MKRHGRRRHFWHEWQEREHAVDEDVPGMEHDQWREWHNHFEEFLGVEPEKHWLFRGRRFKPWFSGKWGPPDVFNPFVAVMMSKGGGLLSLYVLHLLEEKPRYGNDIMREIEGRTQGRWGPNPGAIYPMLTMMEKSGFIDGKWEDPEKRTRRIYSITPAGREELERLKEVIRPKLEEAIHVLSQLYDELEVE
ncbi:MAG: hypothetical protein GTO18_06685 [Anaerolineales bacterium]|nr:hypothetical protein [Anaerolineales bacterium]